MSEAFSRILIDRALEDSNWDLLKQVHFELSTSTGRADYVLKGLHGPLCVIEAKSEDRSFRQIGERLKPSRYREWVEQKYQEGMEAVWKVANGK